jgi:hypothetical protein
VHMVPTRSEKCPHHSRVYRKWPSTPCFVDVVLALLRHNWWKAEQCLCLRKAMWF